MSLVQRLGRIPVLAWMLGACGGGSMVPDSGPPADASSLICDGAAEVRLVFMMASGGADIIGMRVTRENGIQYLLIDGQCRYWALSDPILDVRTGTLSSEQATALANELRIWEWERLQGQYVHGYCDGPNWFFRLGRSRIVIPSACGARDTAGPVQWLESAIAGQLGSIYASGSPFNGSVRFLLVRTPDEVPWGDLIMDRAANWPLAEDPASVALSYAEAAAYQVGTSRSLGPPDAELLRTLRRNFVASAGVPYTGGYVPVLGPLSQRYELFVRDSIPLEDSQGLLFHLY
jgi:hypothetical protein